jgi:hypothetical protein
MSSVILTDIIQTVLETGFYIEYRILIFHSMLYCRDIFKIVYFIVISVHFMIQRDSFSKLVILVVPV